MKTYERPQSVEQPTADSAARTGRRPRPAARSRAAQGPGSSGAREQTPGLRVAILDGDSGFLVVLAKRLESTGWRHQVLPLRITAKALSAIEADVLMVDPSVLGSRRWVWLARLCQQRPDLRVIACQASSTVGERVRALRLGVDDWLGKPCHPEELIARIEALTHRRRGPEKRSLEPTILGEVEIRPDHYQAFVRGVSLRLTRREYQLIELLSAAGSEVLHRELIYESLWGYEMVRNDRSVDVFVHKLRRKLELASPSWRYIHTHFGVGYQLVAEQLDCASLHELRPDDLLLEEPLAA
ncbi:MAG: response regulator transcription factor [Solirubrobacteraceae bacterium]